MSLNGDSDWIPRLNRGATWKNHLSHVALQLTIWSDLPTCAKFLKIHIYKISNLVIMKIDTSIATIN